MLRKLHNQKYQEPNPTKSKAVSEIKLLKWYQIFCYLQKD